MTHFKFTRDRAVRHQSVHLLLHHILILGTNAIEIRLNNTSEGPTGIFRGSIHGMHYMSSCVLVVAKILASNGNFRK